VRLRFRPVDATFYELFARSARHLVEGAGLLAEMLGEANDREAIAQRMRDMEHQADETTHEIVRRELANQVEVLQRCAELTAESMPRLQTMKNLEEYWIEINRLENAGDKSYRRILAKLFGGGYEALEVLKLKDVVDALEDAIDAFETVANIVEQIAVKES